jgi:hypothetical protein
VEHLKAASLGQAQNIKMAGKACQDKHSSLLQTFLNYGCKKLYNMATVPDVIKLLTDVISIKLASVCP